MVEQAAASTPAPATSTTPTPTSHPTTADHRATTPDNLAALCRRHHNAKTTGHWHYQRDPDGTYTWHGPHAAADLVTRHGTTALAASRDG